MDKQTRITRLKETFDVASAGYDSPALQFFNHAADQLASRMALAGHEHILDVACGTGKVSSGCRGELKSCHLK